jgi:hypothetical protein
MLRYGDHNEKDAREINVIHTLAIGRLSGLFRACHCSSCLTSEVLAENVMQASSHLKRPGCALRGKLNAPHPLETEVWVETQTFRAELSIP